MFPKNGSMTRRLAFLHWLQRGEVRQLQRYYQDAMTPCRLPVALPCLRLTVPRFHSLCSLLGGRVSRQGRELVIRYLQPVIRRGANRVLPSSWGTSMIRLPCSKPTPAGLLAPDHTVQQRGPWSSQGKGSHDWVFRRSIAWPSDSLSTLRDANYSNTTQDSLPVAGQDLLDGVLTRKVPMKGFKVVVYISSPLPKLAWRKQCYRARRLICRDTRRRWPSWPGDSRPVWSCGRKSIAS